MSPLGWIIAASLFGGVLSVVCAALFSLTARANWVQVLISFAVGALLGAVFLEILPHALEKTQDVGTVSMTLLAGILLFFLLERLVLWRHAHPNGLPHDSSGHSEHASGVLIMVGDTVHNFVDGVIIAAAFMSDVQVGVLTSIAIIAHEIPQEVGDFLILLHAGFSKAKALAFNVVSSLATLVGALLAYAGLRHAQAWLPVLLSLAAASLLYVAVADLIPGLHKRASVKDTVQQTLLIGLGVFSIWAMDQLIVPGH